MSIDNFTEYVTLKYNQSYYDNNYTNEDGVIIRRPYSNKESQAEKGVCLFQCFTHFTNCYISQASTAFEIILDKHLGIQTRCCCSQEEVKGLNGLDYSVIRHKETGIEFVIGRVCFEKLFAGEKDKLKYFFQPNCKLCDEKIKRNKQNTKGFCDMKCLKEYNDREEQIRKKKEWDDGEPEREVARLEKERIKQKKWDDEAPEREALIAKNEALIAELKEKKIKFPFGEWFNCQGCNVEKKTDFERKYKWCKKCGKK